MRQIVVITTHFPFGVVEENWVAVEIEKLTEHFDRVVVFPVKELSGRRTLPPKVELWQPLVSKRRSKFFFKTSLRLNTWRHFVSAMRSSAEAEGSLYQRLTLCLKFSCYRQAFETHQELQSFLSDDASSVVYAYWGHIPSLAIPTSRRRGAATCVRYHHNDLYVEIAEPVKFYPWQDLTRAHTDLSVFVSRHGLEYFLARTTLTPKQNAAVARLGSRDYGLPGQLKPKSGDEHLVVVSASWIVPVKRVDSIAYCVASIAERRKIVWHHFGGGDHALLNEAIAAAERAGAEVQFHGKVSTTELQNFYRQERIDFFINLSESEGLPVSIMEALNADIPVVASDAKGTSDAVVDGVSGMLVSQSTARTPRDVADRILKELEPGGLISSSRPREFWKVHLDGDALAESFARKLSELSGIVEQ